MKTRLVIIVAFALSICIRHGSAYTITPWSYEDLFAKSDFVVIAAPSARTRDTSERMTLQKITPPVSVIGVTTEFQTLFVLKGSKARHFTLHHYREPARKLKPNEVILGGPDLLTFDPPKREKGILVAPKRYLLFLVREADGRFAPVSGQQDPRDISVQEVSGITVDN
jgi:hypothetical protein